MTILCSALLKGGYLRAAFKGPVGRYSGGKRGYMVLRTVLNPRSPDLRLPTDLPSPPKTIILLTTPKSSYVITPTNLLPLSSNRTTTILAATVDSLPGAPPALRPTTGYSWLLTSADLFIGLPPIKELSRSLTFTLPGNNKITIPLRNTMFENGAQATLLHIPRTPEEKPVLIEAATGLTDQDALEFANAQKDVREAWEDLGALMRFVGQRAGVVSVPKHEVGTVEIVLPEEELSMGGVVEHKIPLRALTPARKIVAGMGNILKQVAGDLGPVGASRELEKAVPEYVSQHPPITPGGLSVFARITPGDPAEKEYSFSDAGVRTYRVLSGGGGWGSKAGLLSLDPQGEADVGDFAEGFENSLFNAAGGVGVEGEGKKTGIVTTGQWVQFYAAEVAAEEQGGDGDEGKADERKGVRVGCVPKVEEVSEGDGEEKVLEGVFGGLAEEGVWVGGKLLDVPFAEAVVGVRGE